MAESKLDARLLSFLDAVIHSASTNGETEDKKAPTWQPLTLRMPFECESCGFRVRDTDNKLSWPGFFGRKTASILDSEVHAVREHAGEWPADFQKALLKLCERFPPESWHLGSSAPG